MSTGDSRGEGVHMGTLYFPLNFSVNLKLLQKEKKKKNNLMIKNNLIILIIKLFVF